MKTPLRSFACFSLAALALALAPAHAADTAATETLQKNFALPPMDSRPMVRWWWYGPAVVKPQLEKEMNLMKEGGFGGFEVQPTYPLAVDGQYPGLVNLKFLSPEFYDMLGFAAGKAKELGLRMDLTLGSGWPYGGPMITRDESAQTLTQGSVVQIAAGQTSVAPSAGGAGNGRRGGGAGGNQPIAAALLGPVTDAAPGASPYIALKVENGAAQLPANLHGATQVTFFSDRENIMIVKRPAYGAEGSVVDHYGPAAIKTFIDQIALPEINACGPNAPYAVFCDSLEISGEGWTPTFLAEFQKRRNYDLAPLLPALFDNNFPGAAEIRADYGHTLVDIFQDNFVKTFAQLAKDHNSRFRIQAYGNPPTTLSTYAAADMDEGENYNTRQLSGTRWAASASHLLGRPLASAEAFTWSHAPVFNAVPMDIKAEANLDFLNGINQFVCHGWPYNAPGVEYPGWHFYVAAVFNDRNPWWIAMPDLMNYLGRASYMLRQGTPANDVALYLPEEDAYTRFTPSSVAMVLSTGGGLLNPLVNNYIPAILDAGYNFDVMDDGVLASHGKVDGAALAFGEAKYKVIVLPNVTRIPLETLKKFAAFADNGGILIAAGSLPSQAPGFLATEADNKAVQELAAKIFQGPNAKGIVTTAGELSATLLKTTLRPDVAYSQAHPELGVVHRHTAGGEVYFLVNTSNQPVSDTAIFRVDGMTPELWDPVTGTVSPIAKPALYKGATGISFTLAPYGSQFFVFTARKLAAPATATAAAPAPLDLSKDWNVTFKNASPEAAPAPQHVDTVGDWTANPALTYFSGTATYEKQVDVPAGMLQPGLKVNLNLGEGQANGSARIGGNGMSAAWVAPIGDVAVIWVNGQRAGALWCPPYNVDVTSLLKPGANQIRIQVANRAINYLADHANHAEADMNTVKTDPRLGTAGNNGTARYSNENLNNLQPLPSGLLGGVRLVTTAQ